MTLPSTYQFDYDGYSYIIQPIYQNIYESDIREIILKYVIDVKILKPNYPNENIIYDSDENIINEIKKIGKQYTLINNIIPSEYWNIPQPLNDIQINNKLIQMKIDRDTWTTDMRAINRITRI